MALSILSLSPLLGPLSPGLFGIISVPRSLSSPLLSSLLTPILIPLLFLCVPPFAAPFHPPNPSFLSFMHAAVSSSTLLDFILVPLTFL